MTHLQDPDDILATKEVMRIACNFADGAKELITLVIGLSVIRPLLFLAGSTAFEAAGLHLLREYSKRGSPVLEFKDFELVELLQGFT